MDRPASALTLAIDLTAEAPLRVGAAVIDPLSREATFADGRERLQPQPLKVLVLLARHRGAVVTREELVEQCWGRRFVGDDVINRSISLLRSFACRAGGFTIETVPKAGYRLVEQGENGSSGRRWWIAGASGLLLAGTVAAFLLLGDHHFLQGKPSVPTVAVLPVTSSSNEPLLRSIALGSRDALSHDLTSSGFPVRLVDTVPNTGETRIADFIISGDVRRNGGSIEANVRMEDPRLRSIVFTHHYEEPLAKAASLPDQIGAGVATNLSWTGALMALDRRGSTNPAITAELLRQLSMTVEGRDGLSAYEIARRLALQAPNSAIAQVSLAFNTGFVLGELPREQRGPAVVLARHAAERAAKLAPEFGDVFIPWCLLHSPVRFAECETRFRAGMRTDPDAPFVAAFYSTLLDNVGRDDESLEMARLALAGDAYKPAKLSRVIRILEATGEREEAAQLYAQAIRWWPHYDGLGWSRLLGMIQRGDDPAIEVFLAQLSPPGNPAEQGQRHAVFAALQANNRRGARLACIGGGQRYPMNLICMTGLARLGAVDDAFAIARRLFPVRTGRTQAEEERRWLDGVEKGPLALLSSPAAAAFRRDPRFLALADSMGLLNYWRGGRLPDFCAPPAEPVCAQLHAGR